MTIEQRQTRTRCEFWLDGTHIGHVYNTYHPDISYEAYAAIPGMPSNRVNTIKEAQEWVRTTWLESQRQGAP